MNREHSHQMDRQEAARRYLLGTLSEEEEIRVQEQFSGEQGFEELEIAEDELIDVYVRDELSAADKIRFEKMLESPRLSERVELARLFAHRADSHTPALAKVDKPVQKVSWWRKLFGLTNGSSALVPAFMTTLAILVIAGLAVLFLGLKLRRESQQLTAHQQQIEALQRQLEEQRKTNSELATDRDQARKQTQELEDKLMAEIQRAQEQRTQSLGFVITSFLTPYAGTRSQTGKEITIEITKDTRAVNLKLDVEHGDYQRYQATVQDADRKTIRLCRDLAPSPGRSKSISCVVPASRLTAGAYQVHVDGLKPDGTPDSFDEYTFRIIAR